MRYLVHLIILTFLSISCSKKDKFSESAENHFFLENEGAIMPVHVKGNTNSKVFIIVLHGGPGGSAIQGFENTGVFENLESAYGIVYWDQRCAGLSQGNCAPSDLQVNDFVEDIDKLILVLENIYGNDLSLFLLGHSWGATLGLDYLINGEQKSKIKGYVQSNGSHNIPMLFEEQKEMLLFYANQQIGLSNNVDKWQNILNEISDADPTIEADRITILNNTYKTEELFVSVDSVSHSNLPSSLNSLVNGFFPALVNENANSEFTLKLFDYDITNELNKITTPIALYWGKFDLVHPQNMAIDIFSNLNTSDKELYFFTKSFHTPMANENELYQLKVEEFVEIYK